MTTYQALAMALAVAGGVLYHLAQKSVPRDAAPLAVLGHAYLVGAALALALVGVFDREAGWQSVLRPRLISLPLGVAVLLIEVGVLLSYRAGWPVGMPMLVGALLGTLILLPVGVVYFGERLTLQQWAGAALCLVGLGLFALRGD